MHTKLVIVFALVCAVVSHDVSIGTSAGGRKIFDEIRQANPAIWRQIENVTIIAPSDEVISGVVVTDMRPDKDGDAQIVDGGEGQDRVTIELKSPTVLRGYDFHLEVFTVSSTKFSDGEENLAVPVVVSNQEPESNQSTTLSESDGSGDRSTSEMPTTEHSENSDKDAPILTGTDLQKNVRPARRINEELDSDATDNLDESPISASEESITTELIEKNTPTELSGNTEQNAPAIIGQDLNENINPLPDTNDNGEDKPQINNFHDVTIDDAVTEGDEEANTTEIPENNDNDAPTVSEIARPARETNYENNSEQAIFAENVNVPSVYASDASTTESPSQGETTTELNVKTAIEEEVTSAPVMLDNSKNIPDYPSLDILDLIKEKEGTRRIRHTEGAHDVTDTKNNENATTELNADKDNAEVSSEASVHSNDDTIDLLPPVLGATYNTEFLGEDNNIDNNFSTTEPTADANNENEDKVSTTETSLDEQSRNIRNAASTNTNGDFNNLELFKEPQEKATCGTDFANTNVIVLNRDALTGDVTKLRYEIPIVLVLANGNLPIIKIILEDNTSEAKPEIENIQAESPMAENPASNEEMMKNYDNVDLVPPREDSYEPKPVMLF